MEDSCFLPGTPQYRSHNRARAYLWRTCQFQEQVLKALGELQEAVKYVHHGVRAEHVQRQRHANLRRGNNRPPPRAPSDVPGQTAQEPHYVPEEPVPEAPKFTKPEFVLLKRPEGARERTVAEDAESDDPFVKVELPPPTDKEPPPSEMTRAREIVRGMLEVGKSMDNRRVAHAEETQESARRERALDARLAAIESRQLVLADLADQQRQREIELRAAQVVTATQAVEIEERTKTVTRRAERVIEVQAKAEQVGMIMGNYAESTALVGNFLEVTGLTIERVSRLGLDATDIARILVRPATSSADLALELVRSCTALPKWAGRVVSAIGAAGLLGVAIPIPPVAAAAGVTSATFLIAGLGLNVACYIVESPFHGLAGVGRLTNAGITLAASGAGVAAAMGQVVAMPSKSSSLAVRTVAGGMRMGANLAMRVARSTTITASYVDTLEESVTTRTTKILSAVLAPTIAHAETSLALMRARLAADAAALERHTVPLAELSYNAAVARPERRPRAELAVDRAVLRANEGSDPNLAVDAARFNRAQHAYERATTGMFQTEVHEIVDVAGIANSLVRDPAVAEAFRDILASPTVEVEEAD